MSTKYRRIYAIRDSFKTIHSSSHLALRLCPLQRRKDHLKMGVLCVTLNCIWLLGSSLEYIWNVEYLYIAITLKYTDMVWYYLLTFHLWVKWICLGNNFIRKEYISYKRTQSVIKSSYCHFLVTKTRGVICCRVVAKVKCVHVTLLTGLSERNLKQKKSPHFIFFFFFFCGDR